MISSKDDIGLTKRSSAEDHVIKSPRDVSVVDHNHATDLVCGRESPVVISTRIKKYNLQNNNEPSFNANSRLMNSRAYAPLPFTKFNVPLTKTEYKAKHKVDVATRDSESFVGIETQSLAHFLLNSTWIYSPVPYNRYSNSYSPVNWPRERPVQANGQEVKPMTNQKADDILMLETDVPASKVNSVRNSPVPDVKVSKEIQELRKVHELHLKEKEELEKVIKKREYDINRQLREIDKAMGSVYLEHAEIEEVTGAFADAMKASTIYKDEAPQVRAQHIEQEIISDILFDENARSKEEIRALYDEINEIHEGHAVGLQGLKQDTQEIKCVAELLNNKNEDLRTCVDVDILKPLSVVITEEKNGEGVVPGSANKDGRSLIDHFKSKIPAGQLSAVELARVLNVREKKSRIPKLLVQTYGSTSKNDERLKALKRSSVIMFHRKKYTSQSKKYKIDTDTLDDQRHVTKPYTDYLDPNIELRRLKERFGWVDKERFNEIKRCRVNFEESEDLEGNTSCWTDEKPYACFEKKHETTPKCCKKKEIRSKTDTGLKDRPFQVVTNKLKMIVHSNARIDKSASKKDVTKIPVPIKCCNKSDLTNKRKQQYYVKNTKSDIPSSKNVPTTLRNANGVPRSSSAFGNKTPLPSMKQANQNRNNIPLPSIKAANQRKDLNKESGKHVATRHVLQPIKPSKMKLLSKPGKNIEPDDKSTHISKKQVPEASLLPTKLPNQKTRCQNVKFS
ncbi:uncharacterized protein LOC123547931 [Mercenaria mercenaria]|uniref:uncharacterized protein LOC123547931 n=1 Tax=Mercenaria mercenaria TaxID=6596 RepID=UPI00234E88B4|nr:uncharacterized protein LOC123547931 [Mercenaria mercenaria]